MLELLRFFLMMAAVPRLPFVQYRRMGKQQNMLAVKQKHRTGSVSIEAPQPH